MINLKQIKQQLKLALSIIVADKPIQLVYLYGSVAEGYALSQSDIDLALILAPDHNLSAYQRMLMELDIAADLEARLGGRQIDVRSINDAPITVQGTILTVGILVFSQNEDFRVDYETLTRKQYFDFLPAAKMMQKAYFEQTALDLPRKGLLSDG